MSVLLDTGVFLGMMNPKDDFHAEATAIWKSLRLGKHGKLFSLDAVYIEALNHLARKPRQRPFAEGMCALRQSPASPVQWLESDPDDLHEATNLYFRDFERGLSLTDCLLVVASRRLAASVATLDRQFQGLASLVEQPVGRTP